jgi:ABC-type multidrug transport system ATPase subunit
MNPVFPLFRSRAKPFSMIWILVSAALMLPSLTFHRMLRAAWALPESVVPEVLPMYSMGNAPSSAQEQSSAIRVTGLSKKFGKVEALQDVSFEVKKGETVVLWGPNGAGKTTVLRCLLGTLPFEGKGEVLGWDVARYGKTVRGSIGYVPQEIRLHTDPTVFETVSFYAALRRVPRDKAEKLIHRWGLADSRERFVNHLSGGMKQKLALIIALLSDPSVLFLDESTSHLDLKARHEFAVLLSHLRKEGKTMLICSHQASEVWKVADRVIVLEKGKKVKEGTPEVVRKYLGGSTILFLTLAENQCGPAAQMMKDNGFQAEHNRIHLLVKVPSDKKTEPLRLLNEAGIRVLDFDLENEKDASHGQD